MFYLVILLPIFLPIPGITSLGSVEPNQFNNTVVGNSPVSICSYLLSEFGSIFNPRLRDMLVFCSKVDEDQNHNGLEEQLSSIISRWFWLSIETRASHINSSGSPYWPGYNKASNSYWLTYNHSYWLLLNETSLAFISNNVCKSVKPEIASDFSECYCNLSCRSIDIDFLSRKISRMFHAYFMANHMRLLDYVTDPYIKDYVYCKHAVGCCYYNIASFTGLLEHFLIVSDFIPANCDRFSLRQSLEQQGNASSKDYVLWKDCVSIIMAKTTSEESLHETCDLQKIIASRNEKTFPEDVGVEAQCHLDVAFDMRVPSRIQLSKIGFEDLAGEFFRTYPSACSTWICSDMRLPYPFHQNTHLHSQLSIYVNLTIALDSIIAALNGGVMVMLFVGYQRTQKQLPRNLSKRAFAMLFHICMASLLLVTFDIGAIWTNFLSAGTGSRVFRNEELRQAFCCDEGQTRFYADHASLRPLTSANIANLLQLFKSVSHFASLFGFLAFALVQVLPLVDPFRPRPWLSHPKLIVTSVWILSVIAALLSDTMFLFLYPRFKNSMSLQAEGLYPDTSMATSNQWYNSSSSDALRESEAASAQLRSTTNNNILLAASLLEIVVKATSLLGAELCYGFMIFLVLHIHGNSKELQNVPGTVSSSSALQQQKAKRTLVSVSTMGLSMTALFVSSLPLLILSSWFVALAAAETRRLSKSEIYSAESWSTSIRLYFLARLVLLLEPLLSPILIVVRYESLTTSLKDDIQRGKSNAAEWVMRRMSSIGWTESTLRRNSLELDGQTTVTVTAANS